MIYNFILPNFSFAYFLGVRSFCAFFLPLLIWWMFGKKFIATMQALQTSGQPIRELGPKSHMAKAGTPTMGGLLLIALIIISTLLFADVTNIFIYCALITLLGFGLIGAIDDYAKIKLNHSKGLSVKQKFSLQILLSLVISLIICESVDDGYRLFFPLFSNFSLNMGYFYLLFASFVIIGSSNAVNLTDGLDGLAALLIFIAFACFALICYATGFAFYSDYFSVRTIIGASELVILCVATMGSCLGFYWYNSQPASIFMGDTGSLSLGALFGCIGIMVKQEICLAIIGGVFVVETLSVLIQVYYFKYTKGKRIFKMSPLHHHFEQCGWPESKVVARFVIAAICFSVLGLTILGIK